MKNEPAEEREICGERHPLYQIPCMKLPDHDGQHWFMTRWEPGVTAGQLAAQIVEQALAEGTKH